MTSRPMERQMLFPKLIAFAVRRFPSYKASSPKYSPDLKPHLEVPLPTSTEPSVTMYSALASSLHLYMASRSSYLRLTML